MFNPEDCRKLAAQYRERSNGEDTRPRLANVLLSVSNAYLALASQLELLAVVEQQESSRTTVQELRGSKQMATAAYITGTDIERGDLVKIVDGQLFPARNTEENVGAAAQRIPAGVEAFRGRDNFWRRSPPFET